MSNKLDAEFANFDPDAYLAEKTNQKTQKSAPAIIGKHKDWAEVHPQLENVASGIEQSLGYKPTYTSGFRTQDEQNALQVKGKANVSLHTAGHALDQSIAGLSGKQISDTLSYYNQQPGVKASVHNGNHIHIEYRGDDLAGFDPDSYLEKKGMRQQQAAEQIPEEQGQRDIRDLQKVSGEQSPETPSIPMEEYKGFQVPVGNNGRIRRAAIDRLMERQGGNLSGLTELITGKQPKERNFLDNAFIEATTDAGDVLRGTQEKNPAGFGEAMGNAISHFTNSALNLVPGVSGLRGKIMGTGQAAVSELEKMLGDATTSVDPKTLELLNAKMEEYKRQPMSERVAASAGSQVEKLRSTLQGNEDVYKAVQAGDALPDIPEDQKTFLDKAKENELIENEVLKLRKEQTPGSALAGEVMGSILPYNAASKLLNFVPGLAAVEKGKFIPEITKLLGRGALANVAVGQAQNPSSDWKKIGVDAAFGAGGEAVGKLIPAVLKGIGSTVEKTGPQLVNTVLDVPLKDLKHGNFGEELLKKGLYGTEEGLLNKAQESIAKNSSKIESALKPAADAGQVLDNSTVLDELLAIKDKYATANKFTGTRPSEMRAIDRAIDRVKSLDPTNPLDAQAAKQEIYEIAQKAYGKDVLPIKSDIETATARGLKKGIENIVPEAKDLNQESSFMINLRDLLTNKIAKGKKMADVGLTPGGRGIVGSALGNMPTSLTLPAAQILRQVGRGIQGGTKAGQFLSPTSGGGWFRVLEDLLQQDR